LNNRNGAIAHLMNVGHGNVVVTEQIVAIVALDHLILSSLEPATLAQRLADRGPAE
jgi:regulator of extracellular matrix RemA (YlzA/DUF370 family)